MDASTMVAIQHVAAVGVTGVAAYTDVKKGTIPNWLTYPVLVAGPILFWIAFGQQGLWDAGLGLLACGLVPFAMWRSGGMGGGEVKLLAGLGALTGVFVGIEIEFYAMAAGLCRRPSSFSHVSVGCFRRWAIFSSSSRTASFRRSGVAT